MLLPDMYTADGIFLAIGSLDIETPVGEHLAYLTVSLFSLRCGDAAGILVDVDAASASSPVVELMTIQPSEAS